MEPVNAPEVFDYGTDGDPDEATVARAFADLDRLVLQAERAIESRQKAEAELQRRKDIETELLTRKIPELLKMMRLQKCTTASGVDVAIKHDVRASLPGYDRPDARSNAIRWLVLNGHAGVIKNTVRVDLDRGEDMRADELVADLRIKGFEPTANKDVHAGTLAALVRELMGEGKIIPPGTFSIFDQRVAKLSRK